MNAMLSSLECVLLAWALLPVAGLAAAFGSGLLLATAPLHRSYGASGIMDGPLSFFMLLAFALAVRGSIKESGFAWGLALCSKQTALFFLPLPVLAVGLVSGWSIRNAMAFFRGAWWPCFGLFLWEILFAHPRLGAFIGMSANQPEVGLRWLGLGSRLQHWAELSQGDIAWAPALRILLIGGLGLATLIFWRAESKQARAWSLALVFPLFCMLVFAALNMRDFDRYPVPYAWALCSVPAMLGLLWQRGSRPWRWWGGLVLGLGFAALVWIRWQPLAANHQGAAGNGSDGYRALLLDLKQREPEGATLVSAEGGLRFMGSWYLNSSWTLIESPEPLPPPGKRLFSAGREGSPLPPGRTWTRLKRFEDLGPEPYWVLYRASDV